MDIPQYGHCQLYNNDIICIDKHTHMHYYIMPYKSHQMASKKKQGGVECFSQPKVAKCDGDARNHNCVSD